MKTALIVKEDPTYIEEVKELINSEGLGDDVQSMFQTFYEMGFTNFEENCKILELENYDLLKALEIILDKSIYAAMGDLLGAYNKD